jgi:hypothetical protein
MDICTSENRARTFTLCLVEPRDNLSLASGQILLHDAFHWQQPKECFVRRLPVGIAAACLIAGSVCFGIFLAQTVRFIIHMPSVDVCLAQVGSIQRWGWYFLGLYVAGFAILFLMPEPDERPSAEPGAAPDPAPNGSPPGRGRRGSRPAV